MTRTAAFRLIYYVRMAALAAALLALMVAAQSRATLAAGVALAVVVVLVLSGRVQALFWGELLAGLHHLGRRDYAVSRQHSQRFLEQLAARPWLRVLIWLSPNSYTASAEVMALNNLGGAELGLGEIESARRCFARAIELDPLCPLPYRNMGLLTLRTATADEAHPWFERAEALGLRGGRPDEIAQRSAQRNAAWSTTGAPDPGPPLPRPAASPVSGAWLVYVVDDDVTPFEVAVRALEQVFGLTGAEAIRAVREADAAGRGVCAGYDDAAEARRKAQALSDYATAQGYKLTAEVTPGAWR